jgi:hypothetical protein
MSWYPGSVGAPLRRESRASTYGEVVSGRRLPDAIRHTVVLHRIIEGNTYFAALFVVRRGPRRPRRSHTSCPDTQDLWVHPCVENRRTPRTARSFQEGDSQMPLDTELFYVLYMNIKGNAYFAALFVVRRGPRQPRRSHTWCHGTQDLWVHPCVEYRRTRRTARSCHEGDS